MGIKNDSYERRTNTYANNDSYGNCICIIFAYKKEVVQVKLKAD